jgi:hypothetical protein
MISMRTLAFAGLLLMLSALPSAAGEALSGGEIKSLFPGRFHAVVSHQAQDNGVGRRIALGDLDARQEGSGTLERALRQIMHQVRQMAQRAPELHPGRSGSGLVSSLHGQIQTYLTVRHSLAPRWPG